MKLLVLVACLLVQAFAREATDDFSTTWFRACTTATNNGQIINGFPAPPATVTADPFVPGAPAAAAVAGATLSGHGGTACIVYNPVGRVVSWTIAHSFNPLHVTGLQVSSSAQNFGVRSFVADRWAPALPFRPRGRLDGITTAANPSIVVPADTETFIRSGDLTSNPTTGGLVIDLNGESAPGAALPANFRSNVDNTNFHITFSLISTVDGNLQFVFDWPTLMNNKYGDGRDPAIASSQADRPYFPTAPEKFVPFGTRVLLQRNPLPQPFSSYNDLTVVSVGRNVAALKPGQRVWARMEQCFTQLVTLGHTTSDLPADRVLANSPFCVVDVQDVLGVVGTGVDRARPWTGHVKKVSGPGIGSASAFIGNFRTAL